MFPCCGSQLAIVDQYDHAEHVRDVQKHMKKLNTGDILLFYLKGLPACIARNGIRSNWDHIGFVIRRKGYSRALALGETIPEEQTRSYRKCKSSYCTCYSSSLEEHVELLESTASGVHVYSLEERILRARSHYKIVAVRHLENFKWTHDIQERLEKFIRRVRGRAYQYFNMRVLKMALNKGMPNENKSPIPTTGRKNAASSSSSSSSSSKTKSPVRSTTSLFQAPVRINQKMMCSELAAAALMAIGVLPKDVFECNDIGPTTFSSLDSDDLLNRLTMKEATYAKEFVFHYPNGPYDECLDMLSRLIQENNAEGESGILSSVARVTSRGSRAMIRAVRRTVTGREAKVSAASSTASAVVTSVADDEKHFSTEQAIEVYGGQSSRRKSFLTLLRPSFRFSISASAPP